MSDYDNTNQGVLFKNKKKESENHPDYRGSATLSGIDYWVSGWINTGKEDTKIAGEKYMKLAFSVKEEETKPAAEPQTPESGTSPGFKDDIPF